MMEYLKYAYSRAEIFRPLYEALPIAGVDGTLGNRMKKEGHIAMFMLKQER